MRTSHRTSDLTATIGGAREAAREAPLPPRIRIRPLEPSDRAGVAALFRRLTPESRRRRFLVPKPELSARELTYLTAVDHRQHEALAAIDRRDGAIIGVARYAGVAGRPGVAEAAVAVADDWQRLGIGTALVRCLLGRARANEFDVLTASTLWENRAARRLLRRSGFRARGSEGGVIDLELVL
jgi:RimJ/RimL family protein N-acetyltransferase